MKVRENVVVRGSGLLETLSQAVQLSHGLLPFRAFFGFKFIFALNDRTQHNSYLMSNQRKGKVDYSTFLKVGINVAFVGDKTAYSRNDLN